MKKHILIMCAIILILVCLCIVLFHQKNAEHSKMETLCQSSIAAAFEDFTSYESLAEDHYYRSGVAEFLSFMTAYLFLNNNDADPNYIWCNTLYGEMILHPEKVQENIEDLVEALEHLNRNYTDPNGFNKINALANKLTHSGD